MAVAPTDSKSIERQVVEVGWDTGVVSGEVVQLRCVNPENGDVSVSGVSRNIGSAFVSYPIGYAGMTHITVQDNDNNSDTGYIEVDGQGNATVPTPPDPPPDTIPPDPSDPNDPHPEHPIYDVDFWFGNLPPFVQPVT